MEYQHNQYCLKCDSIIGHHNEKILLTNQFTARYRHNNFRTSEQYIAPGLIDMEILEKEPLSCMKCFKKGNL